MASMLVIVFHFWCSIRALNIMHARLPILPPTRIAQLAQHLAAVRQKNSFNVNGRSKPRTRQHTMTCRDKS